MLLGPYAIANACRQACRVIARKQPGVVVGFGGFASFPGALMGVARNLPLVIHNLDARAGLANRVLEHGADRVLTGFPGVLGEGTQSERRMGRQSVACRDRGSRRRPSSASRDASGPLRLLVHRRQPRCARAQRRRPARAGTDSAEARPIVAHQSGEKHIDDAASPRIADAGVEAECVPFIDDMARALREADVVVCRSRRDDGRRARRRRRREPRSFRSRTRADDHQADNAEQLVRRGGARAVDAARPDAAAPADVARTLDAPRLAAMAATRAALRKAGATKRVADICLELAKPTGRRCR